MSKPTSRSVTRREVVAGLAAGTAVVGLPLVGIGAEHKPRKFKVIVAGAHPDDPESAAGGTAARYADLGHDVVCLYLTRGEAGLTDRPVEAFRRLKCIDMDSGFDDALNSHVHAPFNPVPPTRHPPGP
jgi:hypothetical protein